MLKPTMPLVSLGTIHRGSPYKFNFKVTNDGPEEAVIENLSVGCGSCTQASTENSKIAPNGSGNINIVFTPNSTGAQVKSVTIDYYMVTSSGKRSYQLTLKFSAQVI